MGRTLAVRIRDNVDLKGRYCHEACYRVLNGELERLELPAAI